MESDLSDGVEVTGYDFETLELTHFLNGETITLEVCNKLMVGREL